MRRRAHPASFEHDSIIDLVIAKDGRMDARDLLGSFDLDIVKSSFDGRFFRIEQPHDAFDKYDARYVNIPSSLSRPRQTTYIPYATGCLVLT